MSIDLESEQNILNTLTNSSDFVDGVTTNSETTQSEISLNSRNIERPILIFNQTHEPIYFIRWSDTSYNIESVIQNFLLTRSEPRPRPRPKPIDLLGDPEIADVEKQEMCSICFDEFIIESDDLGIKLPSKNICKLSCSHHYHLKCIKTWLSTRDSCPMCREKCKKWNPKMKKFTEDIKNTSSSDSSGSSGSSGSSDSSDSSDSSGSSSSSDQPNRSGLSDRPNRSILPREIPIRWISYQANTLFNL